MGDVAAFGYPHSDPYTEIYAQPKKWYRLMSPSYVDPMNRYGNPEAGWRNYLQNLDMAATFHDLLGNRYHPVTYVTYGADKNYPTWNYITWKGFTHADGGVSAAELEWAESTRNEDRAVVVRAKSGKGGMTFYIPEADALDKSEVGDGTVPACSGEAPLSDGDGNIKQSFRMSGFDHQNAYNSEQVRWATFYSIGKILAALED